MIANYNNSVQSFDDTLWHMFNVYVVFKISCVSTLQNRYSMLLLQRLTKLNAVSLFSGQFEKISAM